MALFLSSAEICAIIIQYNFLTLQSPYMPAAPQQQQSTPAIPQHHQSTLSHHHNTAPQTPRQPSYHRQSSVSVDSPAPQAHQDSRELSSPGSRSGDIIRERNSKISRSSNSATSPTRGSGSTAGQQSPPSDALGKALASVSIIRFSNVRLM